MSLATYQKIMERNRENAYMRAKAELMRARRELLEVEVQLSMAYNGNAYKRIGRIHTLDAGIVFGAFGCIENLAELKAQLSSDPDTASAIEELRRTGVFLSRDEDLISKYGRCDTCGAPCDYLGCVNDRKHITAVEPEDAGGAVRHDR